MDHDHRAKEELVDAASEIITYVIALVISTNADSPKNHVNPRMGLESSFPSSMLAPL